MKTLPTCQICWRGGHDGEDCEQCEFDCVHCLFYNEEADKCYDTFNDVPDCPMKVDGKRPV